MTNTTLGKKKPVPAWETITPDMASNWLGGSVNEANRNIRKRKVEQYARDMAEGNWTASNDAICFDEDGKLLNGQHRLSAIVKNGKSVEMLVIRGLPRAAQLSMDTGVSRQFADHLHMAEGLANSSTYAALARQMVIIERGLGPFVPVSHQDQLAWVNENMELATAAVNSARRNNRLSDANLNALAITHFIVASVNGVDPADHYLNKLATPAGEEEGSAVFAVISRLRTSRAAGQSARTRQQVSLLLRGWNHWAVDAKVKMLTMSSDDIRVPKIAKWTRGEL